MAACSLLPCCYASNRWNRKCCNATQGPEQLPDFPRLHKASFNIMRWKSVFPQGPWCHTWDIKTNIAHEQCKQLRGSANGIKKTWLRSACGFTDSVPGSSEAMCVLDGLRLTVMGGREVPMLSAPQPFPQRSSSPFSVQGLVVVLKSATISFVLSPWVLAFSI